MVVGKDCAGGFEFVVTLAQILVTLAADEAGECRTPTPEKGERVRSTTLSRFSPKRFPRTKVSWLSQVLSGLYPRKGKSHNPVPISSGQQLIRRLNPTEAFQSEY